MVFAVLPSPRSRWAWAGPALAVGLVEGIADGSSAVVKLWSGWYSDRITWRKATRGRWLCHHDRRPGPAGRDHELAPGDRLPRPGLDGPWPPPADPLGDARRPSSAGPRDFGKAFGFHEALDTVGALLGPAVAFILLSTGSKTSGPSSGSRLIPGVLAVVLFGADSPAIPGRDARRNSPARRACRCPLSVLEADGPGRGLRCSVNFATAFFTLRASVQMLRPELSQATALTAASVGFYLAQNAVGAAVSFPAGWLADRLGKATVLAAAYALSSPAPAWWRFSGTGGLPPLGLMALLVGAQNPVVSSHRGVAHQRSIVEEYRLGTASRHPQRRQRRRRPRLERYRGRAVDPGEPGCGHVIWCRPVCRGGRPPVVEAASPV